MAMPNMPPSNSSSMVMGDADYFEPLDLKDTIDDLISANMYQQANNGK